VTAVRGAKASSRSTSSGRASASREAAPSTSPSRTRRTSRSRPRTAPVEALGDSITGPASRPDVQRQGACAPQRERVRAQQQRRGARGRDPPFRRRRVVQRRDRGDRRRGAARLRTPTRGHARARRRLRGQSTFETSNGSVETPGLDGARHVSIERPTRAARLRARTEESNVHSSNGVRFVRRALAGAPLGLQDGAQGGGTKVLAAAGAAAPPLASGADRSRRGTLPRDRSRGDDRHRGHGHVASATCPLPTFQEVRETISAGPAPTIASIAPLDDSASTEMVGPTRAPRVAAVREHAPRCGCAREPRRWTSGVSGPRDRVAKSSTAPFEVSIVTSFASGTVTWKEQPSAGLRSLGHSTSSESSPLAPRPRSRARAEALGVVARGPRRS